MTRRIFTVLLVLAVTASLLACGGRRRSYRSTGFIQVTNAASNPWPIEDVHILGAFDSYYFADFIAPGRSDAFEVFPESYDVEVYWGNGTLDVYSPVDVFANDTYFLNAIY